MQLHRGVRRDAWIFCLDYGRLMGDPKGLCGEGLAAQQCAAATRPLHRHVTTFGTALYCVIALTSNSHAAIHRPTFLELRHLKFLSMGWSLIPADCRSFADIIFHDSQVGRTGRHHLACDQVLRNQRTWGTADPSSP
jgi:hypothetical protein